MRTPRHSFAQYTVCVSVAGFFCLVSACGGPSQPSVDGHGTGGASAGGANTGGAASGGGPPAGGRDGSGGTDGAGGSSGGAPAPTGGGDGAGGVSNGAGGSAAFTLTSPAFEGLVGCAVESPGSCDVFPDENVSYMDNANVSPELHWTDVPSGTQSFALVLMDVTYGQAHWALWDIPSDATMLAADVPQDTATPASPAGSRQSNANFATTSEEGYFGPHMPCNVFAFELYALSTPTFSPANPESAVLVSIELQELGEPVLGVARLMGRSGDYGMVCE